MAQAIKKGYLSYTLHNLADWTVRHTRRVDDRPYGGGPGTILMVEPLYRCISDIEAVSGKQRKIYFSPRGNRLTQEGVEIFAKEEESYILICGHYEGIDERIFSLFDITEVSIGDYVISSGELASLVWIDSVVRLIPGVIDGESTREESFSVSLERKREYPQYTRPQEFLGYSVPEILISGDRKKIQEWNQHHTS